MIVFRTTRLGGISISVGGLLAVVVAAVPVSIWVAFRNTSNIWALNDALGVCICCLVLKQLRFSKLRDIAILFSLFFAYDIFMVFLSPYVFGTSVMLDVATAGQPVQQQDWACYCRQNPWDTASCGSGEVMPILLRLPRINDYRGGYTMLGLGDIVIPGFPIESCA
jgi:signal peptide peptidase-like protein 2B